MKRIRIAIDTVVLLATVPIWWLVFVPLLGVVDLIAMVATATDRPFELVRTAAGMFPEQFRKEWAERGSWL